MQKATHIFSAKIIAYMAYLMIYFNNMLTNNIVNFGQMGLGKYGNVNCVENSSI